MITLDEARGRATIRVPEAAALLGVSQDVAYRAAATGDLPTLKLGRRLLVPVPRLLELLGEPPRATTPHTSEAGVGAPAIATTHEDDGGPRHAEYPGRPPVVRNTGA